MPPSDVEIIDIVSEPTPVIEVVTGTAGMMGPQGPQGEQGPAGPVGPTGPIGGAEPHAATHVTGGSDPITGPLQLPYLDLVEGVPVDPAVGRGRIYSLLVNGYSQVEMRDAGANVVRFGSDNVLIAKVTGVPIGRGQCLYLAGASGANAIVGLARCDVPDTMPAVGLALDSGSVNSFIRVLLSGTMQLVNTSNFAEGASLFVSPTSAGAMTTDFPLAPNYAQRVGFVTRSHATQGEILVMTTSVDGPPRHHAETHAAGGTDPLPLLELPTAPVGRVLVSQGDGVQPVFSESLHLKGAANQLLLEGTDPQYQIKIRSNTYGSFFFERVGAPTGCTLSFISDFGVPAALFNPSTVDAKLSIRAGLGGLLFSGMQAGVLPVQIGRVVGDAGGGGDTYGASVEIWPATAQTQPALSVKTPGGGAATFSISKEGDVKAKSFVIQPGSRAYTLGADDPAGAFTFARSDSEATFAVVFSPDAVRFGATKAGSQPCGLTLQSTQAPIVLTTGEAGGSFPVIIGKRLLDGHPAVGASVEIWPATAQALPPLATKAPGGAIDTWGVLLGGQMFMTEVPFASLPAAPPMGTLANISNSTTETPGSVAAGGGAFHVLARWNGSAWKVIA